MKPLYIFQNVIISNMRDHNSSGCKNHYYANSSSQTCVNANNVGMRTGADGRSLSQMDPYCTGMRLHEQEFKVTKHVNYVHVVAMSAV